MILQVMLPRLDPWAATEPSRCTFADCQGTSLQLHEQCIKPLRDKACGQVIVRRYLCRTCGRTFRYYPPGVTRAHTSARLRELGAILYLLGLSYGDVSQLLDHMGVYLCKSRVHAAVQEALHQSPIRRQHIFEHLYVPVVPGGPCGISCNGSCSPVWLTIDAGQRVIMNLELPSELNARALQASIAFVTRKFGADLALAPGVVSTPVAC